MQSIAQMFGFKSDKEVAATLAAVDSTQVPVKMRAKLHALKKKDGGFTLLELLVVIGIIAVLGGLAIGAFGDKTAKAAKSSATNTIASLQSAVLGFQATAGVLPNNLDTLVCADATAADYTIANTTDFGGASDLPGVGGGMGAKLNGKLGRAVLPDALAVPLNAAGITTLRYAASVSCVDDGTATGGTLTGAADTDTGAGLATASAFAYPTGNLSAIDIPLRAFDFPISGTGNRGRGFTKLVPAASGGNDHVVQVWTRGTNGVNNTKVGAGATDVLVALGLGNNSSILTDSANASLASSAFYADVGRDKYGRYLLLVKVGTDTDGDLTTTADQSALGKAKLITVIDPRGDFLDEEYAESTGQKS